MRPFLSHSEFPITRRVGVFRPRRRRPAEWPRQRGHARVGRRHRRERRRLPRPAGCGASRRCAVCSADCSTADPLDIAFVKNTSEGVGIVAEGFPWQAGDNVVTAAEEYPANVYPWMNLANRGVELRRVPSRDGRILLDDLRKRRWTPALAS